MIPRKPPASLVEMPRKAKVLVMPGSVQPEPPQPDGPATNVGCRPCQRMLDSFRNQILSAVRQRRSHRSIAAQYGVKVTDIWEVVADELVERRERREAA